MSNKSYKLVRSIERSDGLHLVVLTVTGYKQACNGSSVKRDEIKQVVAAHIRYEECKGRI